MRDNLAYAHWDKWLTEDGGHHPNPAPVPCESCDNALVEGGKTICKACGFEELEDLTHKLHHYLVGLLARGARIEDHSVLAGTMIGGVELSLRRYVFKMINTCREVGQNVE
jgi:hypothetical protein